MSVPDQGIHSSHRSYCDVTVQNRTDLLQVWCTYSNAEKQLLKMIKCIFFMAGALLK